MALFKELQIRHTRAKSGKVSKIEFSGFDEMVQVFQQMPGELQKKIIVNVLRKGGKQYKEKLNAVIPDFGDIIAVKSTRSKQAISVGPFAKKMYVSSSGQTWDVYQLLYWQNYGTLSRRNPNHAFIKPRAKKTAAWRGGIAPRMLVEKTYNTTKDEIESTFEKEFEKNIIRVLKKFAQ